MLPEHPPTWKPRVGTCFRNRPPSSDTLGDDVVGALSRSFTLGVDGEGRTHHYYRPADTVVTYSDGGVEHLQRLAGRSLGEWTGFVAADCGWRSRGPLVDLADVVDEARDGEGSR